MIPKEMVSTSRKRVGRFEWNVQIVPAVQYVPTPSFILPRGAGEEREPAPDLIPGGGLEQLERWNDWNFIKQ
jgi:hypothetical protein